MYGHLAVRLAAVAAVAAVAVELAVLPAVLALVRLIAVALAGALPWHTLVASALALPVVTAVTWWQARHPLQLPVVLVRWLVCTLLLAAGASLLAAAW